jgi:hypothetical protein
MKSIYRQTGKVDNLVLRFMMSSIIFDFRLKIQKKKEKQKEWKTISIIANVNRSDNLKDFFP